MGNDLQAHQSSNLQSNPICDLTTKPETNRPIEASVALQVLPWTNMEHAIEIIDSIIKYIASTGVTYVVGPFETTMEGDLDTLLQIVKHAQLLAIENGAPEVLSAVKIAYKPDKTGTATISKKISKYKKQ